MNSVIKNNCHKVIVVNVEGGAVDNITIDNDDPTAVLGNH